jgi:hypothetical protein
VAAGWVGLTQSGLSRVERGEHAFTEAKLLLWAQTLGLPEHLRWFSTPRVLQRVGDVPAAVGPDEPHARVVVEILTLSGERIPVATDRRLFLSGAFSAPLVGLAYCGASGQLGALSSIADGSLADVVRNMESLRTALAGLDNVLGSAIAVPTAVHQLSVLQNLSQRAAGRSRQTLMRLRAEYAELTGWFADDLGDRRAGRYWIDRALEWAHEADDEPFIGYVLARKSRRAVDVGDVASAMSLALAAQKRGNVSPHARAAALLWGALAYARSGDERRFRLEIDQARALVDRRSGGEGERGRWRTPGYSCSARSGRIYGAQ